MDTQRASLKNGWIFCYLGVLFYIQSSTGFKDTPQMRVWVVSDLSNGYIKYSNVIYQNLPNRHTKCVAEPDFLFFLVFFSYRGPKVDP